MIKVPYTVTADIAKYEGIVINPTPDKEYLSKKIAEMERSGRSQDSAKPLIIELSKYCGLQQTEDIRQAAAQIEEDVAILHEGKLVAICFCFPSGFDPTEKVGMTFAEMHSPVADNHKLMRAADRVAELIFSPGAMYRRYVWTLTTSNRLSRHPHYAGQEPEAGAPLYFRKETQTTVGHSDGKTCFFFVKVDLIPFEQLDQDTRTRAIESVNSMTEDVLKYKGLEKIKQSLNQNY